MILQPNTANHLDWSEFKTFVSDRNLWMHWAIIRKKYVITATDGDISVLCVLPNDDIAASGSDQEDFEDNYKNDANVAYGNKGKGPIDIGSDFLIESNFAPEGLNQTYTAYSSHTGSGYIWGFKLGVSNTQASFKVVVDGNTLCDLSLNDLDTFNFRDYDQTGLNCFFRFAEYGILEFFPPTPIRYNSSYSIEFKKNVAWNINIEKRMFWVNKE